jgi:lysozyme
VTPYLTALIGWLFGTAARTPLPGTPARPQGIVSPTPKPAAPQGPAALPPSRLAPSARLLDLLKRKEGLRLTAYKDQAGVWTIGYGHTRGVTPGLVWTAEKALQMFLAEVALHAEPVQRFVRVNLTQNQFDALVSLVYNIGGTAFRNSTLLALLNAGKFADAAVQFLAFNKIRDPKTKKLVVSRGLAERRETERQLFVS